MAQKAVFLLLFLYLLVLWWTMFWKKKRKLNTGEQGEALATAFLEQQGYRILARNSFNTRGIRLGELDIVAQNGKEIVFVEVKTSLAKPGVELHPELRVDRHKLRRMEKAALIWLRNEGLEQADYRFDVMTVVLGVSGMSTQIEHFDHVFL